MGYYIAIGGDRKGPIEKDHLLSHGLTSNMLVWCEGMVDWQLAGAVADLRDILPPASPPPVPSLSLGYQTVEFDRASVNSKKTAAGLCAIFLGALGMHKFILGYTTAGVIMLLTSLLTCGFASWIMSIIGIIEGVAYISKTEEQFYREYMLQKKEWF